MLFSDLSQIAITYRGAGDSQQREARPAVVRTASAFPIAASHRLATKAVNTSHLASFGCRRVVSNVCAKQRASDFCVENAAEGERSDHTEASQRHGDLARGNAKEEDFSLGFPMAPHQSPQCEQHEGSQPEC